MPLQATSGAASYDAFGGGVPVVPAYIEEVFSTYLYTGNGSTQTITNGMDLSTNGGMVWLKSRSITGFNSLFDTVRGVNNLLSSNQSAGTYSAPSTLTAFNTTGFNLGSDPDNYGTNTNNSTNVSWTFLKKTKFFDIVTYTGDGTGERSIAHNLGSTPGCVIIKRTDSTGGQWAVWHRGDGVSAVTYFALNSTAAGFTDASYTAFTSATTFTVGGIGAGSGPFNASGGTYVAYLFAHNAGGFGLTGTDNVISCGSYTAAASPITVNLGYEPQWVMVKSATNAANWLIMDIMRGAPNSTASSGWANLYPNTSGAEQDFYAMITPTATGFIVDQNLNQSAIVNGSGTYIYIAIRRGPMKVPTSGTSVFSPVNQAGGGTVTTNFPVDLNINTAKSLTIDKYAFPRLTGPRNYLNTNLTASETAGGADFILFDRQNSIKDDFWGSGNSIIYWNFRRAPSFFDVVCFAQTASGNQRNTHNLTVVPQLIIAKARNFEDNWYVYSEPTGRNTLAYLNRTEGFDASTNAWGTANPTATDFGTSNGVLTSGYNYVAYLFATCAGVSKVGSYTGTGTTLQIDCGFTAGARFVLIKKSSGTGSWYIWDSARGIVSGNDPYLLLNSTAAEVTNTDYIDTYSAGFEISSTAPSEINSSGGSFIFLAIA
jgi:hypothetical protein